MRSIFAAGLYWLTLVVAVAESPAADCCDEHGSCISCTGSGPCSEPRCKASWDEAKTQQPAYSMQCEYACARGRDSWHAPPPECRCCPPCGRVYVKKRLYKAEGQETVERIPKYEVKMVPAEPCDCAACRGAGLCWWNPLNLLSLFTVH
jgi:hypothetical protein